MFPVLFCDLGRRFSNASFFFPLDSLYRINTNINNKFNVVYKRFRPFAPSLNASHTDNVKQCFPQNNRFGHLNHTLLLRLLFSFCVNPLWHPSNKSFDENFSKIEIYMVGIFLSGSNLYHQGHPYDTCTMCRSYSGNNSAVHLDFHLMFRLIVNSPNSSHDLFFSFVASYGITIICLNSVTALVSRPVPPTVFPSDSFEPRQLFLCFLKAVPILFWM